MSLFATQRNQDACANTRPHGARNAEPFVPTLLGHMAASPIFADGPLALAAVFDRARSFAFERGC